MIVRPFNPTPSWQFEEGPYLEYLTAGYLSDQQWTKFFTAKYVKPLLKAARAHSSITWLLFPSTDVSFILNAWGCPTLLFS